MLRKVNSSVEKQLSHLFLILDKGADSFCYYENPYHESELMPIDVLKAAIEFCEIHNIKASIVYGRRELPQEYLDVISHFPHSKIGRFEYFSVSQENLLIIDFANDYSMFETLPPGSGANVIIKMNINEVDALGTILTKYPNSFERLNIIYKNIEAVEEVQLNEFRLKLDSMKELIYRLLVKGNSPQLSLFTDRLILNKMNNCEAGIVHLTVAPNGNFYICPGFYYDNPEDYVGSLKEGILLKNKHLLTIDYSPICQKCDCFQCKRCVYLNKRTTLEVNIPSHEQCVISHHERNFSGKLLARLHAKGLYGQLRAIPPVYHLDPIDSILDQN